MRKRKRKSMDDYFVETMDWFFILAPLWIAWLAFCEWFL